MAIPTTRAKEEAQISIDNYKCTGCGLCVKVCKDFSLEIKNKLAVQSDNSIFGCIGCGHCMAICPEGAIAIHGREISPEMVFDLPPENERAGYESLYKLFQARRSVREFKAREVEPEKIEQILAAARTSPMGLPPSDVGVVIINGIEKNREFARDFCTLLEKMNWLVSKWFLFIMRPFWGKATDELFKGFVKPLFSVFTKRIKTGENLVSYDAPLSIYFYGSPYSDPADPIIAATAAMYAGEALGLGTCMIGSVHPLIQNGRAALEFRNKYKIKFKSREGLIVLFGYPAVKYKKGIERNFCKEEFI